MSKKAQQLLPHLIAHLNLWHEKSFTVAELYDQLLREIADPEFDVLEGVSPAIIRECATMLPEGVVKRLPSRRLVFQSRAFAKPEELHEALHQIERERYPESYDMNAGMFVEKIMDALQVKLVIAREWHVWQSIDWAKAHKQFDLSRTFYGTLLRWTNAGMAA